VGCLLRLVTSGQCEEVGWRHKPLRATSALVVRAVKTRLPALSAYERDMIEYGFAAVRASLKQMERILERSLIKRLTTKAVFRLIDLLPPLRRRMLGPQGGS
jgi:2-polyprenyl-6-methoxyphenol hydroxylase-like FAD-dependent oxidoreductase